ncbi:MAG: apolipoprotein N-acyltransferase [Prochlorothrix sp.]|nr:apolipoprotein N-acyltransferase [Prochlorothrix sp.]
MQRSYLFLGLAALSGWGMALAAPPVSWSSLAWVSFIPLWWVVLPWESAPGPQRSPKAEKSSTLAPIAPWKIALLWGGVYNGVLLQWIWDLHPLTWMGVPPLASVAIAGGAWLAVTASQTALIWAWVSLNRAIWSFYRRNPPPSPADSLGWLSTTSIVLGLALWHSLHTLFSWTPLTWSTLSLTQSPHHTALLHLTQLSGPLTLDSLILGVNGLLAWGIWGLFQDRQRFAARFIGLSLALAIGCWGVGQGLMQRSIADAPEQSLQVGLIQGNIPTRVKLTAAGLRAAETGYSQGYRELEAQGAEVVVLPEGALPVLWEGLNRAYSELYRTVQQGSIPAWVGTFLRPEADRPGDFTQSLLAVNPGGTVTARYNKVKLVPFGEYIPLGTLLSRFLGKLSPIDSTMLPGLPPQTFTTPWGQAAIAICYEPFFPEIVRQQVAAGASFIVTLSNLDPYGPVLMAQHQAQDLLQAVAFDRWLVRVTNTGYSGFISPHGTLEQPLPAGVYGTALQTLYRRSSQTGYSRWGDWLTPVWLGLALLAWICPYALQKLDRGSSTIR